MACSLALARSVEGYTGLATRLKWPNDLLIRGRKVAGILTELGAEEQCLRHAIVGIGLNANLDFSVPDLVFLREQATSLAQEMGSPVEREALLACILNHMEASYLALRDGWCPHQEWAARLVTLGQQVVVTGLRGELEGRAEGVDQDGALLLRPKDGPVVRILAGDVSLRPAEGMRGMS
jgi:BirA family biotin operon repressor/biotin-[acetyl-CoA-carboxylase] ligase